MVIGVMHHAKDPLAVNLDPNSNGMARIAVDEVRHPIQWIEDPTDSRTARDSGAFFSNNGIIGTGGTDGGYKVPLGFAVYGRDQIQRGTLYVDPETAWFRAAMHRGCSLCSLLCNTKQFLEMASHELPQARDGHARPAADIEHLGVARQMGLRVQTLVVAAPVWSMSPAQIAAEYDLTEGQVHKALAFMRLTAAPKLQYRVHLCHPRPESLVAMVSGRV
jgi:hypothetical protein